VSPYFPSLQVGRCALSLITRGHRTALRDYPYAFRQAFCKQGLWSTNEESRYIKRFRIFSDQTVTPHRKQRQNRIGAMISLGFRVGPGVNSNFRRQVLATIFVHLKLPCSSTWERCDFWDSLRGHRPFCEEH